MNDRPLEVPLTAIMKAMMSYNEPSFPVALPLPIVYHQATETTFRILFFHSLKNICDNAKASWQMFTGFSWPRLPNEKRTRKSLSNFDIVATT